MVLTAVEHLLIPGFSESHLTPTFGEESCYLNLVKMLVESGECCSLPGGNTIRGDRLMGQEPEPSVKLHGARPVARVTPAA